MRQTNKHRATQTTRAFTLVEMLVVIALSVLLLGLLFGPLINSFNFTRKTQALVQAQDAARFSLERMNREISEAAYVFDNRNLPVYFPLEDPANLRREDGNGNAMPYPNNPNGQPSIVPIIGSKIDFIPAGTLPAQAGQIQDPTTGGNIDGAALRFPLATGTRIIRYFVGLRRNTNAAGTAPEYYRNVYEFPRTDSDLNPFTLYRVEFEANDPNFFYNTNTAANGASYAANWRALSSPIIQSERADVLFWSKNGNKVYTAGSPAQLPISFGAGVIVGDTATPGFLTNDVSDLVGAVPSLYTSRYGQWTLPYTVTVYRGITDNVLNDPTSGSLSITVDTRFVNNVAEPFISINAGATRGVLATDETNLRYCFTSSGKLFVQTPNLTFLVDPTRGRVETGIPPIQGNSGTRAPQMATLSGVRDIPTLGETGGEYAKHVGDPIPSIFRLNTRDHRAGAETDPATGFPVDPDSSDYLVPTNQGILVAGLFDRHYYPNIPPLANTALAPPGTPAGLSPYEIFTQNGGATAGIAIVSGSERVMGPSATQGITNQNVNLVTYSRSSDGNSIVPREAGVLTPGSTPPAPPIPQNFVAFAANSPQYALETDFANAHRNPLLLFDVLPGQRQPKVYTSGSLLGQWYADLIKGENITGLPASFANDNRQREIQVTYLWQNNYARNANGEAIDVSKRPATKVPVAGDTSGARAPEADVVKVDYSTRALVNVTLGVRIYDPNSGQPENVQLADKIVVRNLGR